MAPGKKSRENLAQRFGEKSGLAVPEPEDPRDARDARGVGGAAQISVERVRGHPNDVVSDEACAFARTVLGALETTLPLEHRPAVIIEGREPGEDSGEVDFAVAEAAVAAGPVAPGLEAP